MSHTEVEVEILQQRLAQLLQRHNEIDAEMKKIHSPIEVEDIRAYRFKREKLVIKNEIDCIEDELSPDIIA